MGKINVLSFEVANLIAAGEVVDRPASVIKELVENSIDSGADRITVEIQRGGVLFMRVTDNGCGMQPEDLPVAVRRHATSKIHDARDLDGIETLGFRGEALAAICAVSDVRIISKTAEAKLGAALEIHSGRVGELTERGASTGTTVIVENLFANVPARLKFLKRDLTEAMAVCSTVEKISMSHPEIAFRLLSDGVMKLETAGDGNLFGVIRSVYGKEFASKMLEIKAENSGITVHGYITAPDAPRANRNYQNFFINGRFVKTRTASAALEQAYTSYIPPEKFPGCVMCIDIPPNAVDVNVHPAKLEVKFSNERPVFDCVYYSVRSALSENRERPSESDNGGIFAPPQNGTHKPVTRVSQAFVPVNDRVAEPADTRPDGVAGGRLPRQIGLSSSGSAYRYTAPETPRTGGYSGILRSRAEPDYTPPVTGLQKAFGYGTPAEESVRPRTGNADTAGDKPDYRIVGEVFNTYIIVEQGDTFLFIDKHAAHERLNFERFKRITENETRSTQMLAVPVEINFQSDELAALEQYRSEIEAAGFSFGTARNGVAVSEIPMGIEAGAVGAMFEAFADVLKHETGSVDMTRKTVFEKALYQASCKASVKGGRVYPAEYNEELVAQLMRQPDITYCPHGRPVAIEVSRSAMDRKFKRN